MLCLVHAAATWFMTGVIWYCQVVHYPLFPRCAEDPGYFSENLKRTGFLVLPVMLAELAAAVLLCVRHGGPGPWAGLFLLGGIWGLTVFQQFPSHLALSRGWSETVFQDAVLSANWARLGLWTVRAALASFFIRAFELC